MAVFLSTGGKDAHEASFDELVTRIVWSDDWAEFEAVVLQGLDMGNGGFI